MEFIDMQIPRTTRECLGFFLSKIILLLFMNKHEYLLNNKSIISLK